MQIVIEIDDKLYNQIKYLEPKADTMLDELMRSVQNGTPLPKGHGRLIDADELKRTMEKDKRKALSFVDLTDFVWLAPTIIEGSDSDDKRRSKRNR